MSNLQSRLTMAKIAVFFRFRLSEVAVAQALYTCKGRHDGFPAAHSNLTHYQNPPAARSIFAAASLSAPASTIAYRR